MNVWVTATVNQMIDQAKQQLSLQHKEGLVHAIMVLALTDEAFMNRAAAMSRYLGDLGQQKLENKGL